MACAQVDSRTKKITLAATLTLVECDGVIVVVSMDGDIAVFELEAVEFLSVAVSLVDLA
jgi:hypothetical protein